jgi:hypothetical protein
VGNIRKESHRGGDMKKWIFIILLLVIFPVQSEVSPPPEEFFVEEYTPQAVIVVGDTASADDVISATLLATRIADMTTRKELQVTETVYSETEHTAFNMVPFVRANYHLLFDLDDNLLWFYDYRLERLKDTIPGGFIPTRGRTWASRTTPVHLLGDYYSMLEIRKYDDFSWWYLFYGIPRNYEHQYFKKGEKRAYGKYTVELLDVDVDEMESKIRITSDVLDDTIFLPVYCKDCKHVVGELFCNATDPLPPLQAADMLQADYPSYFVNLKYFVDGPLSNPDAVARAHWYWNPPPVPGTPDMFIDGQFHIDNTSTQYFTDYFNAFYASVQIEIPLRVYTTGFIGETTGHVNTFLSSDYNLDDLVLHYVIFEKTVDVAGTIYRNVVRDVSPPVFLSLRAGQVFEHSYKFTVPAGVVNPETNVGAVVFVQNTVTKRIHQADVLDLREKRYVYEVDVDADFDGRPQEVEFAIECTDIPFLGVQGNAWARFDIYLLTDTGVLFPRCCDTPFFEDEIAKWDLQIFKKNGLGYILVNLCDPFDISCLEPGDIIYGPRHLTRVYITEVTDTVVRFTFQFMKIMETEVEGAADVQPSSLLRLANEVTDTDMTYNLILIGGPDVNLFTREIVEMGLSTVVWSESAGEWEYIINPFGYSRDVLIVAGKDRESTSFAARKLYYALEFYED